MQASCAALFGRKNRLGQIQKALVQIILHLQVLGSRNLACVRDLCIAIHLAFHSIELLCATQVGGQDSSYCGQAQDDSSLRQAPFLSNITIHLAWNGTSSCYRQKDRNDVTTQVSTLCGLSPGSDSACSEADATSAPDHTLRARDWGIQANLSPNLLLVTSCKKSYSHLDPGHGRQAPSLPTDSLCLRSISSCWHSNCIKSGTAHRSSPVFFSPCLSATSLCVYRCAQALR